MEELLQIAVSYKVLICILQYIYHVMLSYLAPSSAPTLSLIGTTSTSIAVNWTTISDANGYIIYSNSSIYDAIGGDNTSIIVDRLIPGENYSITVRAYQDILGPDAMLNIATDDGNQLWY